MGLQAWMNEGVECECCRIMGVNTWGRGKGMGRWVRRVKGWCVGSDIVDCDL